MDSRREFIKKASILAGGTGLLHSFPPAIAKAFAINPAAGSTYLDAEHVIFLMQENRSFDHTYGSLQGVRGFEDPRAMRLPNNNPVWLQSTKNGDTYVPFRMDIKNTKATWMESLPHSWADQVDARNNGRYDQWLEAKRSGVKEYGEMPLTLGYYTREDIPFYYSMADAFTVCDQNFCSSLTGTTPNRLYFWTGTIREKPEGKSLANVWNEDADYDTIVSWTSFPERMEKAGIPWKVYQNEIGIGAAFEGEEDAWLSNFGDNPLEYMKQYHVKLSPQYIRNLPVFEKRLQTEIDKKQAELNKAAAGSAEAKRANDHLEWLKKQLEENRRDQKEYTLDKFNGLSAFEKALHEKAFSTNAADPNYHQLDSLEYTDTTGTKKVAVPKGDILHEFRKDVKEGKLPTVSWLVAPQNFSDHPSAAWYGAWYISEVMDILTNNPEVWKKTIFVLNYDENDGYFDHVSPFVAPHPTKRETGFCSKGINTAEEFVADSTQQSIQDRARNSSIGLGYRVPMVIASPWSRGGWVNSEVFDHTSSLQFLETFLSKKTGKKIRETNISEWRRTVCGDLTSAFRMYDGEKIEKPLVLDRNQFVESIHQAQFRSEPTNYKKLSAQDISSIQKNPRSSSVMPTQEKGTRPSYALPYELYAEIKPATDKTSVNLHLSAGKKLLKNATGAPFQVISLPTFTVRDYAVKANDTITDSWRVNALGNEGYHLRVHGPNGFYREMRGELLDSVVTSFYYISDALKGMTGEASIEIEKIAADKLEIEITDNAYGKPKQTITVDRKKTYIPIDIKETQGWYDVTLSIKGNKNFERRYCGRVETGMHRITDPAIGASK